eukprot:2294073-Pyramimonas_sp.AAC.1
MALFVSWICTRLHCTNVFFSIEQPVCSCLKHHPAFLSLMHRVPMYRLCTHLGAFGANLGIPKAVHIFTLCFAMPPCQPDAPSGMTIPLIRRMPLRAVFVPSKFCKLVARYRGRWTRQSTKMSRCVSCGAAGPAR